MRETLLLSGFAVVIAGLLSYNLIYMPKQQEIQLIQSEIVEERARQQTEAEVAALAIQLERYRKRLPTRADASWLVDQTVAAAKQTGIKLAALSRETPQRLPQYTRLAVEIRFYASYHQVGSFINTLEQDHRFIRIERILIRKDGRSETPEVTVGISTLHLEPLENFKEAS